MTADLTPVHVDGLEGGRVAEAVRASLFGGLGGDAARSLAGLVGEDFPVEIRRPES